MSFLGFCPLLLGSPRRSGGQTLETGLSNLWLPLALLLLGADPSKNELKTRVFPPVSIAKIATGCAQVLLTVEISGPETEAWYCPKIEWEFPDETRASEESDCAPFSTREDYPRRWSRRICAPPHPLGDTWVVVVRFSKGPESLAKGEIRFLVK
jgi:hypothetical protein